MEITTPAQLTAYLKAIAQQHPRVAHIITGEGSRQEESTRALAKYPQVRIETPEAAIPRAESQKILSSRIYVCGQVPPNNHADDDRIADEVYRIAENIISVIDSHTSEDELGISLATEQIEIKPMIAMGDDQLIVWMFDVEFEVDRALCKYNAIDPTDFFMPQFRWENNPEDADSSVISFSNESFLGVDAVLTWFWKENEAQPVAAEFDPDDGIELAAIANKPGRVIHVWLRATYGDVHIWTYARIINGAEDAGTSIPFIPHYPS